jgi:hypothetical protein
MTDVQLVVEAAKLLGRWTLIAEKHANGCSCCPGLGDVTMEQVEGSVASWLRERHPLLQDGRSVTALLKNCISRTLPAGADALEPLFKDIDEAFGYLERVQRGY